jgi:hypothetical protein
MVASKQVLHDLFIQGKSYKEIAIAVNSNASAIATRIQKYRKEEPDSWPRLHNYIEPISIKVQVFQCSKCVVLFAVEKDSDLSSDITCPFCWEHDRLKKLGFSNVKVKEAHLQH